MKPTITKTGPSILLFTPKSKNHFFCAFTFSTETDPSTYDKCVGALEITCSLEKIC